MILQPRPRRLPDDLRPAAVAEADSDAWCRFGSSCGSGGDVRCYSAFALICETSMDNPKPPFYRRLFTLTWEGAYRWLLGLALGAILAWLSQRRMPSATPHPAAYWFLSGGVFFGSFAAFLSLAQGTAWSIRKVRAMCNPPKLTITAHGGNKATVEVQHGGVPAVWQARIRILKVSGNTRIRT